MQILLYWQAWSIGKHGVFRRVFLFMLLFPLRALLIVNVQRELSPTSGLIPELSGHESEILQ